ncbi:MAG: hypothetical protein ACHQ53_18185 [Polyangiales bacterium]
MNRLPIGRSRGVSAEGGQSRGRQLVALAFRVQMAFGGLLVMLSGTGCGPRTGPGLEPPVIGGGQPSGAPIAAPTFGNGGTTIPTGSPTAGSSNGGAGSGTPAADMSRGGAGGPAPLMPTAAGTGGTGAAMGGSSPSLPGGLTAAGCVVLRKPLLAGVHLVVDASASTVMPNDVWSPLGRALASVLASESSSKLAVGAQLFQGSCDPSVYTMPAVPIGPVASARDALASAMSSSTHQPGAATALALDGALTQAQMWAESSQASAAVVLISGSEPTGCFGNPSTAALAAAGGLGMTPPVTTHVVALGARASLDQVAQAGGTGAALAVSDPTSESQILAAVQAAVSQAACSYALPTEAAAYVPDRINLELDDHGAISTLPRVSSAMQCDATLGGWFYDDPKAPTTIVLCDATCAKVTGGAGVSIAFGCPTTTR